MHSPRAVVRPRTAASAAGRTGISPSSRSASPSSVPTERWRSNHNRKMKGPASLCARHRSPSEIVRHAVWLCQRSNPTNRGREDLSAERGISDSQESIGLWWTKSGSEFANRLKLRHTGCGETFFGDEVVPKVNGKQHFPAREPVGVLAAMKKAGALGTPASFATSDGQIVRTCTGRSRSAATRPARCRRPCRC
jgi:putative transposase